jgi:hypothetical protein
MGGMEPIITDFFIIVFFLLISSPLWVPIPFLCYAITRKRFSVAFLFLLLTAEALSLAVAKLTLWGAPGYRAREVTLPKS